MTIHLPRKEASLVGSLLDQFPEKFPPNILSLLRYAPESFDDLRHGTVARAIYDIWQLGKPVHSVAVAEFLEANKLSDKVGGAAFLIQLVQSALPLSICEVEAQDIWQAYQQRRSKTVFDDAAKALQSSPEKAALIIEGAESALHGLRDENGQPTKFTIRRPSDIMAMQFDDSDKILGDRLFALGQSLVIAAASGTGKSRLLLQLIAAVISGEKFLTLDTFGPNLTWLVIQTENSNRRLKDDCRHVHGWMNGAWDKFDANVRIHTIENEIDSFVALDNPENVENISAAIEDCRPNIVCIDPLNDFGIGDINKDVDMRATLHAFSRVARKTNPQRGLLALHHAITGRAGAAKATGFDRSSFARNSKSLHAWARGVINIAPVDESDNDRLIVACGKCSNGREFLPFAARLNLQSMIYECDPSVDIKAWENTMAGKDTPLMNEDRVAHLCSGPLSKQDLCRAIVDDCGCSRATAYRHIFRAEKAKTIQFGKDTENYTKK